MQISGISPSKVQVAKPVDKTDDLLKAAMDGQNKINDKMLKASLIERNLNPNLGKSIDIKV